MLWVIGCAQAKNLKIAQKPPKYGLLFIPTSGRTGMVLCLKPKVFVEKADTILASTAASFPKNAELNPISQKFRRWQEKWSLASPINFNKKTYFAQFRRLGRS